MSKQPKIFVFDKANSKEGDGKDPSSPPVDKANLSAPEPTSPRVRSALGGANKVVFSSIKDARQIWNAYKPEAIIGKNIFNSKIIETMRAGILSNAAVQKAIGREVSKHGQTTTDKRVEDILDGMMAQHKQFSIRFVGFCLEKIVHQMYSSVHVVESEMDRLKEFARKAQEEGVSLIMTPTHKSHMDYLILGLLCFFSNISMPYVASGENLNIPLVGSFLQTSGAFFIRRTFQNDELYKAIFSEYLVQIMIHGFNLEFFPEGGRSRSGKLLNPKMGMLQTITASVFEGRVKDAYFVPINISYEKVMENETYTKELLGQSKQPESLRNLMRSAELLKFKFGSIDIRIGEPRSIKSMIERKISTRGLGSTLQSNDRLARSNAVKQLVSTIAYSLMYKINNLTVCSPTSLVVTVLLTHAGRGITRNELIEKVKWLRREVKERRGDLSDSSAGDAESMVDAVTYLLGNSVDRHTKLVETIFRPAKRFELAFYRNQIIHLFVPEATIACSLYAFAKSGLVSVPRQELLGAVKYLSRMFKWEFIFKPASNIETNFDSTLASLTKRGVLVVNGADNTVSATSEGEQLLSFLRYLLWPFIDAYWVTSLAIYSLYPASLMDEKDFIKKIQRLAETLYYLGELSFFESIAADKIQTALQRSLEQRIIEKQIISDKGLSILKLCPEYQASEEKIADVPLSVGRFKRVGKYSVHNAGQLNSFVKEIARKGVSKL